MTYDLRAIPIIAGAMLIGLLTATPTADADKIDLTENIRYEWGPSSISLNGHTIFKVRDSKEYEDENCEGEEGVRILSLVGPIVSFVWSGDSYCEGAAYMNHWKEVRTYRLRASRVETVHLFDLFPAENVIEALANDTWVKQNLGDNVTAKLEALFEARESDRDCRELNYRALYSFSFHHIKNDRVAVRIHLPRCLHDASTTVLGVYLKAPEGLRRDLDVASKKGVLEDKISKRY